MAPHILPSDLANAALLAVETVDISTLAGRVANALHFLGLLDYVDDVRELLCYHSEEVIHSPMPKRERIEDHYGKVTDEVDERHTPNIPHNQYAECVDSVEDGGLRLAATLSDSASQMKPFAGPQEAKDVATCLDTDTLLSQQRTQIQGRQALQELSRNFHLQHPFTMTPDQPPPPGFPVLPPRLPPPQQRELVQQQHQPQPLQNQHPHLIEHLQPPPPQPTSQPLQLNRTFKRPPQGPAGQQAPAAKFPRGDEGCRLWQLAAIAGDTLRAENGCEVAAAVEGAEDVGLRAAGSAGGAAVSRTVSGPTAASAAQAQAPEPSSASGSTKATRKRWPEVLRVSFQDAVEKLGVSTCCGMHVMDEMRADPRVGDLEFTLAQVSRRLYAYKQKLRGAKPVTIGAPSGMGEGQAPAITHKTSVMEQLHSRAASDPGVIPGHCVVSDPYQQEQLQQLQQQQQCRDDRPVHQQLLLLHGHYLWLQQQQLLRGRTPTPQPTSQPAGSSAAAAAPTAAPAAAAAVPAAVAASAPAPARMAGGGAGGAQPSGMAVAATGAAAAASGPSPSLPISTIVPRVQPRQQPQQQPQPPPRQPQMPPAFTLAQLLQHFAEQQKPQLQAQ